MLELARELKLLQVGTISVDGTGLKANASKHRGVNYERSGQLVEQLEEEVRAEALGIQLQENHGAEIAFQSEPEKRHVVRVLSRAFSARTLLILVPSALPRV